MNFKLSNGAGILNWVTYADLGFDEFVTKSIGLNGPDDMSSMSEVLRAKYWNGELGRNGWNPPVMVHGVYEGKEYFVNRMGLPNPGVKKMIADFNDYKGNTPIIVSIFGQNDAELERIVNLFEADAESYKKIKGFEVNKSCPNTKPGESCSTNDLSNIISSVRVLKNITSKKVNIKFSPLVNAANFINPLEEAGADAATFYNTVPCLVINKYSNKPILKGGLSGQLLFEHAVYNVYNARLENESFPINISGGVSTVEDVKRAFSIGANTIQLGSVFAGKSKKEISNLIEKLRCGAVKAPYLPFKEPLWWNEVIKNGYLTVINDEHKEFEVERTIKESADTYTLVLKNNLNHTPGQYVMAMVWDKNNNPMERPFTMSGNNTITIKRRGETSTVLTSLTESDKMYIRGPKGNGYDIESLKGKKLLLIGGGCGIASLTDLAEKIDANIDCIAAYKDNTEILSNIEERLKLTANYKVRLGAKIDLSNINARMYDYIITCGPEPMIKAVAMWAVKEGVDPKRIIENWESYFKCGGYGLCSSCDTGPEGDRICLKTVYTYFESKNFRKRGKDGGLE
ncbi:Sulfhydrogenase 2 subunit gamma [Candidatus Tiddalikarchaeum anstoanum]|nr:Sulfhydrogenase 2 subunit gamma [Candidatus Tiddalikarchaeum anstoanum]